MTTEQVRQAREQLGARLRAVRIDARLTGRQLAAACQWHFTKISKIENGRRPPSIHDIHAWCFACNASEKIPDLVETARAIESMYTEWQRLMRGGLTRSQESSVPLYDRTMLFRGYENTVIPGLFHTAEYATAILQFWNEFLELSSDVDEAVATRMDRQQILYRGRRQFLFVLEEQTLWTRVGDADVMVGQLDRLLAVLSLTRVNLAIIPAAGERFSLTQGSFWIFDDERVQIEGVSAGLDITQPREVALHVKAFATLQRSARQGSAARELIHRALQYWAEEDG